MESSHRHVAAAPPPTPRNTARLKLPLTLPLTHLVTPTSTWEPSQAKELHGAHNATASTLSSSLSSCSNDLERFPPPWSSPPLMTHMAAAHLLAACRRHISTRCGGGAHMPLRVVLEGVGGEGARGGVLLNPSGGRGWRIASGQGGGLRAPWMVERQRCGVGEVLLHDLRHKLKVDLRAFRLESWLSRSHRSYSGTSLRKWLTAATLACARSQVVPRIVAVVLGEATLARQSAANPESLLFPVRIDMKQPPNSAHIVSFAFSLLEFFILMIRAAYLAILFTPAVVLAPFADSCGPKFRKRWVSLVHLSLENAGAAFIKWGQWAAARPDLFPPDLCAQLTKLHSKAPAHKYAYTKQTIEGAFGRKVEEIFEDFEEEPVASGSIAQIHRAVLRYRYPGQISKPMVVAVKVRHPGVSEVIRRDFTIINWCAKISNFIPGLAWLRLDESIGQFAVFMLAQVDLAREAAQLSRFNYNFRRWKDVSFPRPLYPLVHPAVLVETFEQGESVSRFVDRNGKNRLNSALASIGTHTLLKMLLVDNFVHADLHPGNILVRIEPGNPAPNKQMFKSRPHVVLLDVGMTAELNGQDRHTLLDFFKAIARHDGRVAANCALKFSRAQNCPNPEAFIQDVEKVFQYWDTDEGDALHAGECMQELLEQVRRHKVNIDGDVCTVMVTTLVLEGWQRKLDPDFNIMDTLRQLLSKADWLKSLSYTIDGVMAP